MAKPCSCGYTRNADFTCDGSHKIMKRVQSEISENILKWHTPQDNTTPCCYGDCTHEEDAAIARGEVNDSNN